MNGSRKSDAEVSTVFFGDAVDGECAGFNRAAIVLDDDVKGTHFVTVVVGEEGTELDEVGIVEPGGFGVEEEEHDG